MLVPVHSVVHMVVPGGGGAWSVPGGWWSVPGCRVPCTGMGMGAGTGMVRVVACLSTGSGLPEYGSGLPGYG